MECIPITEFSSQQFRQSMSCSHNGMYLADSLSFFMLISFKKYSLALNEPVKFKDVSLKNRKMLFLS